MKIESGSKRRHVSEGVGESARSGGTGNPACVARAGGRAFSPAVERRRRWQPGYFGHSNWEIRAPGRFGIVGEDSRPAVVRCSLPTARSYAECGVRSAHHRGRNLEVISAVGIVGVKLLSMGSVFSGANLHRGLVAGRLAVAAM